jgi:hypothetical protein
MISKFNLRFQSVFFVCFVSVFACAQHLPRQGYSDDQAMRRAISHLPVADPQGVEGSTPLTVYFNYGLGTQFNRPTSLTAVFCDRPTAFAAIEDGISKVLSVKGYDISSGWDKTWGKLKARKQTDSAPKSSQKPVIFMSPLQCEDISLSVKIDQIGFSDRALTVDYTVLAGPRTDLSSMNDVTSHLLVDRYMDTLFGALRRASEDALIAHCARMKISDIDSEEDAIRTLVQKLHLNGTQEAQIRSAVRKDNE